MFIHELVHFSNKMHIRDAKLYQSDEEENVTMDFIRFIGINDDEDMFTQADKLRNSR